jgi:hypothetical protein
MRHNKHMNEYAITCTTAKGTTHVVAIFDTIEEASEAVEMYTLGDPHATYAVR